MEPKRKMFLFNARWKPKNYRDIVTFFYRFCLYAWEQEEYLQMTVISPILQSEGRQTYLSSNVDCFANAKTICWESLCLNQIALWCMWRFRRKPSHGNSLHTFTIHACNKFQNLCFLENNRGESSWNRVNKRLLIKSIEWIYCTQRKKRLPHPTCRCWYIELVSTWGLSI